MELKRECNEGGRMSLNRGFEMVNIVEIGTNEQKWKNIFDFGIYKLRIKLGLSRSPPLHD